MAQGPILVKCPVCGGAIASTAASCPHCGYRPNGVRASSKINIGAIALGIGALLVAVGSFLPWMWTTTSDMSSTFVTSSRSGLDLGLDGMFTLGIGIVLGPLAFANFTSDGIGRGSRLLSFLGGLGAIAIAIVRASDVAWRASPYLSYPYGSSLQTCKIGPFCPNGFISGVGLPGSPVPLAYAGAGIALVGIGGAVAVLVALSALVRHRLRRPHTSKPA